MYMTLHVHNCSVIGLAGKITMGDGKVLQDADIVKRLTSAPCTLDNNASTLLRSSQKQVESASNDSKSSVGDQNPSNRCVQIMGFIICLL
jgi:hypothetical protein